MWLRHAHNPLSLKGSAGLMALLGFFLLSACSPSDQATVDKLNSRSYACHYRNIDSTEYYARQALDRTLHASDNQQAESLNNLAFVSIIRMDYDKADQQLADAEALTNSQIELMVCYVQQMRLCQRRSRNREFHEYRERAMKCLNRINEERSQLSPREQHRLTYAESEMAIVNSTYYYYVGLERQSVEAMEAVDMDGIRRDTAQYENYLYNVGAGGILTDGTPEAIHQEEIDILQHCLSIAQRHRYPYFEAQAKEALADHTGDIGLAAEALQLFQDYGDVYQIAGAYRTLASCYHAQGDHQLALENLEQALADSTINQAPDLVASIREQLSVAYAAVDDKPQSDFNRNIYLDLQEQTRQDREMEARAGLLDASVSQLNWMLWAVIGAIVLLLFLLWLFNWLNRRQQEDRQLVDLLEQKSDELRMSRLNVERLERRLLEQRAKVSLVNSITPFIDRILYSVDHLDKTDCQGTSDKPDNQEKLEYIRELTDKISEQNEQLTQWIQLRQGELSLHIESFPLAPLFDIVARGRKAFDMKGITLCVEPTTVTVKADRVLTLFMLNTLADNARKFTELHGTVTISAKEQADYVELSVQDTGCGMTDEQLAHVFDHKIINDGTTSKNQESHGFGLMNCKGIIEKYRKISRLFSVCLLSAESEPGRGSRFFFRLPKGMLRCWLVGIGCWLFAGTAFSQTEASRYSSAVIPNPSSITHNPMDLAHIYADSAYFSNIRGTYEQTLQFADSCLKYLNQQYLQDNPKGRLLMTAEGDNTVTPSEIQWLHDNENINYQVILDIRNESAVAALALHQWQLYAYNNKVYTQLFKELSADNTLPDYCRMMQESQQNKRIAVILLIVTLLLIVPAYYMLYYRHRLYSRHRRERLQLENIEMADDELRRAELEESKLHVVNNVLDNCLSALKHETMYYPSRIRQLVDGGDIGSLHEVTSYYRELYGLLSLQAARQAEQVTIHVRKTELYGQPVLGDENLLSYLFELLNVTGDKSAAADIVTSSAKDEQYVLFTVNTTPRTTFDYLLCRQIARDHGEATHRRGCGIRIENGKTNIILPRYNGQL